MNALWCSVMIEGRIFFNLFARTFENFFVKDTAKANGAVINDGNEIFYFWD